MDALHHHRVQLISTLVGCFCLFVPAGMTWYWGNMSIYVYSYIHYHQNTKAHEVKAPWLLSVYIIMWSTGMLIAGQLSKCLGRRILTVTGIFTLNCGFIASYFVIDHSITWLDFTMGLFGGFGNGIIYSVVLETVVEWTDKRVALATSAVIVGNSVGATIINQIVTHYVNPHNLKVDTVIGRTKFFSQQDILERVPSLFLVLVVFNLSFHVIGFCLIRRKPEDSNLGNYGDDSRGEEKADSVEDSPVTENSKLINLINSKDSESSNEIEPSIQINDCKINPVTSYAQVNQLSKSPVDVLRSRSFYILWITLASFDCSFVILCNYYKAFGQIWIHDDHFLANLGTSLAVSTIVMRVTWGLFLDSLSVKTVLVSFASSFSIVNNVFFFTPAINRWFYFWWTILYSSLSCGVYLSFVPIMAQLYGKEHFVTNYGLLFTATIAINFAAPPGFRVILSNWGWFAVFISAGCFNLLSLVMVVFFLPHKAKHV